MTPETQRSIKKWIMQAALGAIGYGLIIFLAAGTINWVWGWALIVVLVLMLAAHPLLLIPINPELLAEREKGMLDKPVKNWDKWITMLAGVNMVGSWIVAGLDFRFQWTPPMSPAAHVAGLLAYALGQALFMWAMVSNAYFAEGVRIQHERGHTVASSGPYRFVRHPGYVGVIFGQLGIPWLLGSPWALIPSLLLAALFILRTALEDKTLMAELPGYPAFAQKTRYRLLPGIW